MRKVTGGKDRWARTVTETLPQRVLGPVNTTLGGLGARGQEH